MSGPAGRVPWEDPAVPFPANLALTWWECLVSPTRFFSRLDWDGPFARPLLYFLVMAILGGVAGLFWFAWGPWGVADAFGLTLEFQLLSFFLTPFVVLLALGLVALLQHLFAVLLAPGHRGLAATGRVLCYAGGIGLLTGILPPAFGPAGVAPGIAGGLYLLAYVPTVVAVQVWYVVVVVIGIREAHAVPTGRAAAIVLLPLVLLAVLFVILVFLAVALSALAGLPA